MMMNHIYDKELETFVKMHEMQISDTYFSNRFLNNNVNFKKKREVYLCFCCMNERYSEQWTFSFQKIYVFDFNKRKQKFGGLTICSSYKGICKHVATYHRMDIAGTAKKKTASDYVGLFVDISIYLNQSIWDSKVLRFLNSKVENEDSEKEDVLYCDLDVDENHCEQEAEEENCQQNKFYDTQKNETTLEILSSYPVVMKKRKWKGSFDPFGCNGLSNKRMTRNKQDCDKYLTPIKTAQKQSYIIDSRDNDSVTWGNDTKQYGAETIPSYKHYNTYKSWQSLRFDSEIH
jgi:hypothetical protein